MRTETPITLTAAGLVLRALAVAKGPDTYWHHVTVHEHMRDAMSDFGE